MLQGQLDVLYFVYGLAFVIMGVVILAQPRERSQFSVATALPLLAGFGLFHGLHEWLTLWTAHVRAGKPCPICIATIAIAYVLLLEFAFRVIRLPEVRDQAPFRLLSRAASPLTHLLLGGAVLIGAVTTGPVHETLPVWVRYLVCIPAALLTSVGLYGYCRAERPQLRRMGVLFHFRLATIAFGLYAVLAGLLVPPAEFFPADRVNSDSLMASAGFPLQVFSATVAILAAFALSHVMRLFHREMRERLARALGRAEESMRQLFDLSSRHALILRHAGSGIVGLDESGTCAYANPAALAVLGMQPTDLLGRRLADAIPCRVGGPDGPEAAPCPIADAIAANEVRRGDDHIFVRPDGSGIAVEYVLVPTPGDGAVLVFNDISQRKKAVAQLQETAHMLAEKSGFLEQANADLQRYAYVAAHDLRSPLRGVSMLATAMECDAREGQFEAAVGHAKLIRQRIHKMDRLIVSLLDYARAGRITCPPEPVNVGALVQDIAGTLDLPPGFRVEAVGALPSLTTQRVALEQVLSNLIGNAVCHHDRAAGVVRVAAIWNSTRDAVEFRISDDGPGIDPRFHRQVFEMFQRLESDRNAERSGIGLALVKKLIDQAGGQVRIESGGRGTTVHFTWPATETPAHLSARPPLLSAGAN